MAHRLRTVIAILFVGCVAEKTDFALQFTFKGDVCGGLDLVGRQRVSKIEYQVFGADLEQPISEGTMPCVDRVIPLELEAVSHRVVVRGIGDDGNRCWDTGPAGVSLNPFEGSATIDVPQICVLNDAVRLTIKVEGQGDVVSEPAGIDCPSVSCVAVYDRFAGVRLNARSRDGAEFVRWSTSCGAIEPTVAVAMFSNRECVATFADPSRSSFGEAHRVPGPELTADWDVVVQQNAPVIAYLNGAASIGAAISDAPEATGDWQSGEILSGAALADPKTAIDLDARLWMTAGYAREDGCGIAVMSRSTGDFELEREIALAAQPCTASGGHALGSAAGALLLADSDETGSLVARLIEGSAVTTSLVYQAPAQNAVRGASNIAAFEGRPAFAFSVFDRDRERGEVWIALATVPRPIERNHWAVHPLFTTDRVPEAPSLIVDGARFTMSFASIASLGRETEQRSQHLAMSLHLEPRSADDWRTITIDPDRGGPSSVMRWGTDLVIAYGHADAITGVDTMLVATSIESSPIGPENFVRSELDQTVLLSRPRLLDLGDSIGLLYRQNAQNPLVFRSADRL